MTSSLKFRLVFILILIVAGFIATYAFTYAVAPTVAPIPNEGIIVEPSTPRYVPSVTKVVVNPRVNYSQKERAQLEYAKRFVNVAQTEQRLFGIPASITLAQGILESGHGLSRLAKKNNNHFGIKCFSKSCPEGHCSNYTDDSHKDFFKRFKSPWASYRAHSNLLLGERYATLKKHGKNYKSWAWGLQNRGYATSKTYAVDLIRLIERLNLAEYDK